MNTTQTRILSAADIDNSLIRLIDSGVTVPLLVTGSSMLPFLRDRQDTVWLVKADKLHRGQILFFRRRYGTVVLHRIRRIHRDGRLLVNGDAQAWCETVHPEQAIAVVSAITHRGKLRRTDSLMMRIRDGLWYPTRPFRPLFFKVYGALRRLGKITSQP